VGPVVTRYLATPVKGRLGKARQVAPQTFEIPGPHNPDRIKKAVLDAFHKHCYDGLVVFRFDSYKSPVVLIAELYHRVTDVKLGDIIIEELEEEI
jgi:hypothetical protein